VQTIAPEDFRPGGKARITDGAFAGYEGVYLARNSLERVVVMLDLCGKSTRTTLNPDFLQPVAPA